MATKVIFLTSGSSWTVPADWTNVNTIEMIDGGGAQFLNGGQAKGGRGGNYRKYTNVSLTPGATATYAIGAGELSTGTPTGIGGTTSHSGCTTPTTSFTGGSGFQNADGRLACGGGAAGPSGNGANATSSTGGAGVGSWTSTHNAAGARSVATANVGSGAKFGSAATLYGGAGGGGGNASAQGIIVVTYTPLPAWTSADDTTTAAWVDLSDTSRMTLNGTSRITAYDDKGAKNHDLVAGPTGPAYAANALNGLGVGTFTGSEWLLGAASDGSDGLVTPAGPRTFLAVIKIGAGYNGGANTIVGGEYGAFQFRVDSDGHLVINQEQIAFIGSSNSTLTQDVFALVVGSYDYTTGQWFFRINGAPNGSGNTGGEMWGPRWSVGAWVNGGEAFHGQIGEVVALDSNDLAVIQKEEGYLAWKWWLQPALPADHPYKSGLPTNAPPPPVDHSVALNVTGNQTLKPITQTASITGPIVNLILDPENLVSENWSGINTTVSLSSEPLGDGTFMWEFSATNVSTWHNSSPLDVVANVPHTFEFYTKAGSDDFWAVDYFNGGDPAIGGRISDGVTLYNEIGATVRADATNIAGVKRVAITATQNTTNLMPCLGASTTGRFWDGGGTVYYARPTFTRGSTPVLPLTLTAPPVEDTPVNVTGEQMLAAITQTSELTTPAAVSGAQSLAPITQTASATAPIALTGAEPLAKITQTFVASAPAGISGSQTLAKITQSGDVTSSSQLTGAQTLAAISQTSAIDAAAAITGAQTMRAATQTGAIDAAVTVSGAQTLAPITQSSVISVPVYGEIGVSGNQTMRAATQVATARALIEASAAQTTKAITQTSEIVSPALDHVGVSGSQMMPALTQIASASVTTAASAAQTMPSVQNTDSIAPVARITGAQLLARPTQVSTIIVPSTVNGHQVMSASTQDFEVDVVDLGLSEVSGNQMMSAATQSGDIELIVTLNGMQTMPRVRQSMTTVLSQRTFNAAVLLVGV